jgi:hypothetical protein
LSQADRDTIVAAAQALLDARANGRATFGDDTRASKGKPAKDGSIATQLKSIVAADPAEPLPDVMTVGTAKIILRMVEKADERHDAGATGVDFNIVSLARPNDKGGPHKHGNALDIDRYAGQQVHYTKPGSSVNAVAQFYRDMVGDATHGPVDTRFALGLPRTPQAFGFGAAKDQDKHGDKYVVYFNKTPEDLTALEGIGRHRRWTTYSVNQDPALKPEAAGEETFFAREADPNISPDGSSAAADIKYLQPASQQRLHDINSQDTTHVLGYLFPDGIDHFHVQSLP